MKELPPLSKIESSYHDLQSLNRLRASSRDAPRETLKAAVKEFESYFLHLMLKNMRETNKVIGDEGPLNNDKVGFVSDMYDQQLALELSRSSQFGIGDMLFQQLAKSLPLTSTGIQDQKSEIQLPLDHRREAAVAKNANNYVKDPSASKAEHSLPTRRSAYLETRFAMVINPEIASIDSTIDRTLNRDAVTVSDSTVKQVDTNGEKVSGFKSKEAFIESLTPLAKKAAKALGINPGILVAQAALETGWGKFFGRTDAGTVSNNLFGIKANSQWMGDTSSTKTIEFVDGLPEQRNATFKAYQSIEQSFLDYIDLIINNPRYQPALEQAKEPKAYLEAIQSGGYATDPNYAEKIWGIFERENLYQLAD